MRIGSVFDQTSTTEFVVMLDQQFDNERLLFSYVEVSPDGGCPTTNSERIVARITSLHKENPLLSRDQAGISASVNMGELGFDFSRRFTYGWAKCTVIGNVITRGLDMNRRVVAPNAEVHTPSLQTLRQLFFNPGPSHIPLGAIETFGEGDVSQVPVTLDGDQMVTKHFCVFGMTGSGKTNTAARIIEELMARGHRMVIFDSHNDYVNLENYTNLFRDYTPNGRETTLTAPASHNEAVAAAIAQLNPTGNGNRPLEQCVHERLLRTASVIHSNRPARLFLKREGQSEPPNDITPELVSAIATREPWASLIKNPRVFGVRRFPEIRFYGNNYRDFTIILLQAFQNEKFTSAQWRWLRQNINQPGLGLAYLQALDARVLNDITNQNVRQDTGDAIHQKLQGLMAIYNDALSTGATPLDFENFFNAMANRTTGQSQNVTRLGLTDLSSNLRKAMVYGVITYFFRCFKFGGFRARASETQPANAFPVLFVLEEARSLIPRSSGADDDDVAGMAARQAMRELAYEGRKFSLGFGLISQKPSTVDPEVVSQSNTFILHQLKSPDDQEYVRAVTESMSRDELDLVKSLGTGRTIVAGVAVQSPVLLHVAFRHSEEGIREPTPIRDELENVNQIRAQLNIQ
jgi:hypothetical protein